MPKKRKPGRPPKAKGTAREGRLFCRLLKSELREIEAAAKRAGTTQSEWVRGVLLGAAKEGETSPPN